MIYKDERIAIFIDGPNLYAAAKKLELDVDYKALRTHFADSGRLVRAVAAPPSMKLKNSNPCARGWISSNTTAGMR